MLISEREFNKKTVVVIGRMDVYNEIHISNIERNTNENIWLDWEFEPRTPASLVRCSTTDLSRPITLGQTINIPPLQSVCPLRNTQQTMFTLPGLIDLTNVWSLMVTASNVIEKRENIEINFFFIKKKENVWKFEKYWNDFF